MRAIQKNAGKRRSPRHQKMVSSGGPSVCPYCGLRYDDFKSAEDFQSVKDMLWRETDDPSRWRYKRRHTVLGLWKQVKEAMWADHIEAHEQEQEAIESGEWSGKITPEMEAAWERERERIRAEGF